MSTIFTLIVILGLIGAATFLVGFTKGCARRSANIAIRSREGAWSDEGHYGLSALFAVVASAVVIALVGVAPAADLCRAAARHRHRDRCWRRIPGRQQAAVCRAWAESVRRLEGRLAAV